MSLFKKTCTSLILASGLLSQAAFADIEVSLKNPYVYQFGTDEKVEITVSISSEGVVEILSEQPIMQDTNALPNTRAHFYVRDAKNIYDALDVEVKRRNARSGLFLYKAGENAFCQIHPDGNYACWFDAKLKDGIIYPQNTGY